MKTHLKWLLSLLVILPFIIQQGTSQSIKRQFIGCYSSGGISDGIFISQTVGQPFFTPGYSDNLVVFNPGFQQPVSHSLKTKEQLPGPSRLGIFPNPAADNFRIETSEVIKNAIVQVTDINGRLIWEEKVPEFGNYQMDCSRWKNGLYFVAVYNVNKQYNYISKVIISK